MQKEKLTPSFSTSAVYTGNEVALKYLARTLLRFFVDIEVTGSHSQFYDKFNIRYSIALCFKFLWTIPQIRESFSRESAYANRSASLFSY